MSLALAQRHYDRIEPVAVASEDWTPLAQPVLTEAQVEQFISDIADTGSYEDMLGRPVNAPSLYLALAIEYRHGTLPSAVSGEFFRWAKAACYIAEFGKPIKVPALLQEQAGLRLRTNND